MRALPGFSNMDKFFLNWAKKISVFFLIFSRISASKKNSYLFKMVHPVGWVFQNIGRLYLNRLFLFRNCCIYRRYPAADS